MNRFQSKLRIAGWMLALSLVVLLIPGGLAAKEGLPGAAHSDSSAPPKQPQSVVPVPISESWWTTMHETLVQQARSIHPDVAFFGDSITAYMNVDLLHKIIGKGALNFGIPGDETQHLLWRMRNGELDFSPPVPRTFVVLIGTNNMTKWGTAPLAPGEKEPKRISVVNCTNEETFLGVQACVKELRARMPQSKILLLGILPRDGTPDATSRQRIKDINTLVKGLADNKHIWYADIGKSMLEPDGSISRQVMADFLHPTRFKGYTLMFTAIKPHLDSML
jgi:lysophospholipase L1-like esterase